MKGFNKNNVLICGKTDVMESEVRVVYARNICKKTIVVLLDEVSIFLTQRDNAQVLSDAFIKTLEFLTANPTLFKTFESLSDIEYESVLREERESSKDNEEEEEKKGEFVENKEEQTSEFPSAGEIV